mmetsp:Transcript_32109/g.92278  ORF Transcript_32109/g.92278 Transcript_32109/m.92278 type:complete len:276 (-) Transcript_32109:184-1011(-)
MAGLLGRQAPQPPPATARTSDEHVSGIVNLRVRLLEEARSQRERCLRNPESLTRTPASARRFAEDVAAQTEPEAAAGDFMGWSRADDRAQAEAIQAIQRLTLKGGSSRSRQAEEASERAEALERQLVQEQRLTAAAREQVTCLELELDNKESANRILEQTLESRDQELQLTQLQVRRLLWREMERERDAQPPPGADRGDYERLRALRAQVLELEYQLHVKDLEISRLSAGGAGRRPSGDKGTPAADEVSTLCGSERSVALRSSSSTAAVSCNWGH